MQTAADLLHWDGLLGNDIETIFAELPGHGRSPPEGDCTIDAIADRLTHVARSFSDRPIVVVGASMGGLVALVLADGRISQVRGVVAGDPPRATAKQWSVRDAVARYSDRVSPFVAGFVSKALSEADYYQLIEPATVPTLIITGDVPLWPPRNQIGVNVIDDDDVAMVRLIGNPLVAVQRIEGCGHAVLAPGVAASVTAVRGFCDTTLCRR